ncbi:LANO_0G14422g1_1 [Lachancea nothofagi CBS 11611]|uniref:LANO_0G14422g1_1 n=1 Tax=Lachancea nothofagi CBS 11611 TaxID=1266666 RepID=A0A1G4KKD1_9SACH|nr:LANO_0G14422g1_1 [Lachancea nothofagi CBS 11611]
MHTFHKILAFLGILIGASALIVFRIQIIARCGELATELRSIFGRRIQLNADFTEDLEAGLTSRNFDISSHNEGDQRKGLNDEAKTEIKMIMKRDKVNFDQARLLHAQEKFGRNRIAADGTPLDPKAVIFGRT